MALKIRLKRMGKKAKPFYRLVVVDSRWRRDGKSIADVGWYDPVKQPAQMSFKEKEIYHWLENGVQTSETVRALFKQQGILGRFKSGEYKNLDEEQMTDGKSVVRMNEPAPAPKAPPKKEEPPKAEEPAEEPKAEPAEAAPAEEEAKAEAPAEEEKSE